MDEASLHVGCNVLDFLNDRFRVSVVLHRSSNKGKGKASVKLFQCTSKRHMAEWKYGSKHS